MGLKDDKNCPGDFDVIKNWPWDSVPPGTSSKSQIHQSTTIGESIYKV